MKKMQLYLFTRVLYLMFVIVSIISLVIVYGDIDGSFAFRFLIGYLYFALFMILYVPSITFLNLRKFKGAEIRKRLLKFIALFISFGVINYVFDYFLDLQTLVFIENFLFGVIFWNLFY
jgi:hypothetical protein